MLHLWIEQILIGTMGHALHSGLNGIDVDVAIKINSNENLNKKQINRHNENLKSQRNYDNTAMTKIFMKVWQQEQKCQTIHDIVRLYIEWKTF